MKERRRTKTMMDELLLHIDLWKEDVSGERCDALFEFTDLLCSLVVSQPELSRKARPQLITLLHKHEAFFRALRCRKAKELVIKFDKLQSPEAAISSLAVEQAMRERTESDATLQ